MSPLGINLGVMARSWSGYNSVGPPVADLQIHLDASNSTSYPGTGTTWFDLTSNGYDWTINGSFAYSGTYFTLVGAPGTYPLLPNIQIDFGLVPTFALGFPVTVILRARTVDLLAVLLSGVSVDGYIGAYRTGNEFYNLRAGLPNLFVDGLPSSNLITDFADGVFHVVEISNCDLSDPVWSKYVFNGYTSGFNFTNIDISHLLVYNKNLSPAERSAVVTALS